MTDEYVITVDSLDFQWHTDCMKLGEAGVSLLSELRDKGYSSPVADAFFESVKRIADRVNA
jgi:hypothetical protein